MGEKFRLKSGISEANFGYNQSYTQCYAHPWMEKSCMRKLTSSKIEKIVSPLKRRSLCLLRTIKSSSLVPKRNANENEARL